MRKIRGGRKASSAELETGSAQTMRHSETVSLALRSDRTGTRAGVGALIVTLMLAWIAPAAAGRDIEDLVATHVRALLPADAAAGAAVVVRVDGRDHVYHFGWARLRERQPVDSDTLFNLASLGKVFDTTLLALAVNRGELRLDDPVAEHVAELQRGGDIRRVTLGQLASYTSGFTLPQDHPPWPRRNYTLAEFLQVLNAWSAADDQQPGRQVIYSHAGFMLLHVALERRFATPISRLLDRRLLGPLGLASTTLPTSDAHFRGELAPPLRSRTAQAYSGAGEPAGEPGQQQGFYHWPGTGQMYASARDMARFLAANLGELDVDPEIAAAMRLAQQPVFVASPTFSMALAWEVEQVGDSRVVEKYGGLYNASAYIGMIPEKALGVVILSNRGDIDVSAAGRRIMLQLAGPAGDAVADGDEKRQ